MHVLVIATLMNAMATTHKHHSLGRCKHILSAYWAVAVGGALDAAMRILYRDRQTNATCLNVVNMKRVSPILSIPCSDRSPSPILAQHGISHNHRNDIYSSWNRHPITCIHYNNTMPLVLRI